MNYFRTITGVVVSFIFVCSPAVALAQVFQNGSFEVDPWPPGTSNCTDGIHELCPTGWTGSGLSGEAYGQHIHYNPGDTAIYAPTPRCTQFVNLEGSG